MNRAVRAVVGAGLVAGVLDALAAMTMFMIRGGKDPSDVWKYVASGIFGNVALIGGWEIVVWGLTFHFFIALSFALFFFLIYPRLHRFTNQPVVIGLLYGLFVWIIMNRVVLPLSNVRSVPFDPVRALTGAAIIMVMVGLPISLIINRYYGRIGR